MNFSERVRKCFTTGYSQSMDLDDIKQQLLSLTNVVVKLENETDVMALYSIYSIGGSKIAEVMFDTNNSGTMTLTEIDQDGVPCPTTTAINGEYSELFSKLESIINRRINKNFGKVKDIVTEVMDLIYNFIKREKIKMIEDQVFDLAMEICNYFQDNSKKR